MSRAQVKLAKASGEDLPRTDSAIKAYQDELPGLHRAVEQRSLQFEISADAASEREAMKQRAILEHPSPEIMRLQHQENSLEKQIETSKEDCKALDHIVVQLISGKNMYKNASRNFEQALKHHERREYLVKNPPNLPSPRQVLQATSRHSSRTETRLDGGTRSIVLKTKGRPTVKHWLLVDRHNQILSTNFPCPNGCGFLVTWHGTHCCNACARGSGGHGFRCQRKSLEKEAGAKGKLRKWQKDCKDYQLSLSKQHETTNKKFKQAKSEARQAEQIGTQALAMIPFRIRQRFPELYDVLQVMDNHYLRSSPHCGCSKVNSIQEELVMVNSFQSLLDEQLRTVQRQLLARVKNEASELESQLKHVELLQARETDRTFNDLRRQVLGENQTNLPAYNPGAVVHRPSAPSEDQVLAAMVEIEGNAALLSRENIDGASIFAAGYPVPVEVNTSYSNDHTAHVPMATATLLSD
jgi:hypothetical protein